MPDTMGEQQRKRGGWRGASRQPENKGVPKT
jgi:hypothetical protein